MQLFLLIALLLASGKGGESLYSQVKPILECVGGEEVKQAFRSAEEFKGVLSALGGVGFGGNGAPNAENNCANGDESGGTYASTNPSQGKNTPEYDVNNETSAECGEDENCNPAPPFVMAPVARLADREIIYRLAQYFSESAS